MTVYIVNLKTTGETWHIAVALNQSGVNKILSSHGILWRLYGVDNGDFQEWYNSNDKTQTATVSKVHAID